MNNISRFHIYFTLCQQSLAHFQELFVYLGPMQDISTALTFFALYCILTSLRQHVYCNRSEESDGIIAKKYVYIKKNGLRQFF